jgi:hypothetical protein
VNLIIDCPEEPVLRKGVLMYAQEITATVTLLMPNGKICAGTIVFPECAVHRHGLGEFMVDPVTAQGKVDNM